jgi:hypothetical protein
VPETPRQILERWELHGAVWRVKLRTEEEVVVELLTCHGEPVDELRSTDADLLSYLADRPSSEDSIASA